MDQAQTLRKLVSEPPSLNLKLENERIIRDRLTLVITSGKGGVGKSVLAGNLAAAMADVGLRTLLVDGDLMFPNQDLLFGIRPRFTMVEAVEARRPFEEACLPVAPNLWLLPSRAMEAQFLGLESEILRGLRRFLELQSQYDVVVVDTASGLTGRSADFATVATEVWIVTTPSAASVADSYAMVKYLWSFGRTPELALCINGVKNERHARDLHRRFNQVTRQFLRREIPLAGWIPTDRKLEASAEKGKLLLLNGSRSSAGKAIRRMAQALTERHEQVLAGVTEAATAGAG